MAQKYTDKLQINFDFIRIYTPGERVIDTLFISQDVIEMFFNVTLLC